MWNLSSSQLKVATHTHSYDEVGISAGQNITIDNWEISAVDTTYTAWNWLSLSNWEFSADTTVLQEKLTAWTNIDITNNTISATDTTYTAGTWLTLNGTTFAVDTTTIATKADIANLSSFTVVDTLPAVATADTHTIYLKGPIGTGADKYEEWIVTEEYWTSWTTDSARRTIENQVGSTINYVLTNDNQLDWLYLSLNNVWLESWNSISSISFGTDTYTEVPANLGLYTYWTSPSRFSIEFSNVPTDASVYSLTIDSSTSAWWNQKVWTKIWETSIDLSGYATTTALTNWLATKQDTLTAWDGIDISNSSISVDVTDIISTWLSEDANNNIIVDYDTVSQALAWTWLEYNSWSSAIDIDYDTVWQALAWTWLTYNGWDEEIQIDTTVVATQTDLSWKQDKATSGSTAPSTTPSYVWQQYIDTTNDKMYVATGTSSSSDWIEVGAWGWSWDMAYADFNWVTKTWASITLDLNSTIEPTANFTVNAPATIKDWQVYVLRVISWLTVYTMTLGTNVTNPYNESITLVEDTVSVFTFVGVNNKLELQPSVDLTGIVTNSYAAENGWIDLSLVTTWEKYTWWNKENKPTSWSWAPSIIPIYVWQRYFNTSNSWTWYVANGTTSTNDWKVVDTNTTYTAGTWLTLNGTQFAVDTTTIATKADIANLWSFEVVDTLPSVATADTKTIYLLWPIWTGTDKYEEWIVTEEYWTAWTITDLTIYVTDADSSSLAAYIVNANLYDWQYLTIDSFSTTDTWVEFDDIIWDSTTYTSLPVNYWEFTAWTSDASFRVDVTWTLSWTWTHTITGRASTSAWWMQKVWTKIWETSIDAWDMAYADYNWVTKTWATVTLDLNSTITPSANFTVNAPATIKDWQVYVLRVSNWATAYTMTLGTWITNPYSVSTTLTANYIDQFIFQAIGWYLELLPDVDVDGKQDKATTWIDVPSTTPSYIWQQYVDTTHNILYVATWTSSSTNWEWMPVLSKQPWTFTNVKIWVWTQADYEALSGSYDANTLYFTTSSS